MSCASHPGDPGDNGWHIDVSFPPDDGDPNERIDFSACRANVRTRGRALLMLFLFSDVGPRDAPARIRLGSHLDMARFLAPAGEAGMSHMDMAPNQIGAGRPRPWRPATPDRLPVPSAAQCHQGRAPRFMARPPLHPAEKIEV